MIFAIGMLVHTLAIKSRAKSRNSPQLAFRTWFYDVTCDTLFTVDRDTPLEIRRVITSSPKNLDIYEFIVDGEPVTAPYHWLKNTFKTIARSKFPKAA